MTKIKICGITKVEETRMLIDHGIDYAGMILFYPKSKRNITMEHAKVLLQEFQDSGVQTVAVTVEPSLQEITLIQEAGVDYIQIYGELKEQDIEAIHIPIWKAFHVGELEQYRQYDKKDKVHGFVFDGSNPGSGIPFDWAALKDIDCKDRQFILAGGLKKDNVIEAIKQVKPDIIDLSSGVEGVNGKEESMIRELVEVIHNQESEE